MYISLMGKILMYGSLRRTLTAGFQSRSLLGVILGNSPVRWAFQKSTKALSTSLAAPPRTLTCVSRHPAAYRDPMLYPPRKATLPSTHITWRCNRKMFLGLRILAGPDRGRK